MTQSGHFDLFHNQIIVVINEANSVELLFGEEVSRREFSALNIYFVLWKGFWSLCMIIFC